MYFSGKNKYLKLTNKKRRNAEIVGHNSNGIFTTFAMLSDLLADFYDVLVQPRLNRLFYKIESSL